MRSLFVASSALLLAACQGQQSNVQGKQFSRETRALEKQLNAEATAFGAVQGAAGVAASFDPTGVSSMAMAPVGLPRATP